MKAECDSMTIIANFELIGSSAIAISAIICVIYSFSSINAPFIVERTTHKHNEAERHDELLLSD